MLVSFEHHVFEEDVVAVDDVNCSSVGGGIVDSVTHVFGIHYWFFPYQVCGIDMIVEVRRFEAF